MALFKISKGLASNLQTNVPYSKEGNIYYTTDESKFYIDIAGDGSTTSAVVGTNRMPLNAELASQVNITQLSATSNVVYPLLACSGNYIYSTNIGVKNGTIVLPDVSDNDEVMIVNSTAGRAIVVQGNDSNCSIEITSGKGIKVAQNPTEDMELATKQYVDTKASNDHTHSYLTYESDSRYERTSPDDYNSKLTFVGLKSKTAIDHPSSDSYSYLIGLRGWTDRSGGDAHELAFNNSGINWRTGTSSGWDTWSTLLNSDNYSTYLNNTYYTKTEIDTKLADSISGNAATATKLQTARTIALSQDVTGSGLFDGSSDLTIEATLTDSGVTAGTYGSTSNQSPALGGSFTIPKVTVDAKGRIISADNITVTLPANPDSHYTSKLAIGQTKTAKVDSGVALTNDEIYLNHIENDAITSGYKIQGAGATTVSYSNGILTITSANDNTDTKVTSEHSTATKAYLTGTISGGNGTLVYNNKIHMDGSTGALTAASFIGSLEGNATSATKAVQDGEGNTITSTYVKKTGDTMTGTLTVGSASIATNGLITGKNLTLTSLTDTNGEILTVSNGIVNKRSISNLIADLGLSKAMTLIGVATVEITDGSTTDPKIAGYSFVNAKPGDVVIDKDSQFEYVWTIAGAWERLGPDSSYSLSSHVHKVTHQPKGTISDYSFTPAGSVTSTWTGTAAGHTHTFTGDEEELAHIFAGTTASLSHAFVGTEEGHTHTWTGTAATLDHKFNGTAVSHKHVFTGTKATLEHEFTGDEVELTHTFVGSTSNATASYTPAGTITSTFTGSAGNTAAPTNTASTVGVVSVASSEHTHSVTAQGTISAPTFTGEAVTSAAGVGATSIQSITSVGTLPTLTSSVTNHCLTLAFTQGTLPTREAVSVASTGHTHSVTAAGTVSAPAFTGKAVASAGPSATTSVANTTHIHAFTPAGTVASTFKGTSATITSSYTPSGTIAAHTYTPSGTIGDHTYTPAGTLNDVVITPAGTIAAHSYIPAGSIGTTKLTPKGTIAAHNYTPAGSIAAHTYTPSGTISSTSVTPAGSITSTFKGTAVTHNHTFTGTSETLTTTTGQ